MCEFGLVSYMIVCQLCAALAITLYVILIVMTVKDVAHLNLASYTLPAILAFFSWMFTLPLLGTAMKINMELEAHRGYLASKACGHWNPNTSNFNSNSKVITTQPSLGQNLLDREQEQSEQNSDHAEMAIQFLTVSFGMPNCLD